MVESVWRAWRRHPVFDGIACGLLSFVIFSLLVAFALPAWAVVIPLPGQYLLDVGDLPPWIATVIAGLVYWEARKAKKHAAEAATVAKAVSVQVDGLLLQRDKDKVAEGERKGEKTGENAAQQLAEGQRQGREAERESIAAKSLLSTTDGHPLPVADDKVAISSEVIADATKRIADATEVATEAVAAKKKKKTK